MMTSETEAPANGSMPPLPEVPPAPDPQVLRVDAAMAAAWLEGNTHNRKLREQHVDMLAGAMLRGEWKMNGDAIRFDTEGTLLDGQHRLWAVIKASTEKPDITIDTVVIFNLPTETQETMDTGARRSLADILSLRGEKSTANLAATIQRVYLTQKGEQALRWPAGHRLTPPQALAFLEANPSLREVVRIGQRFRNHIPVSAAIIATCVWQFDQIDHNDSLAFWNAVAVPEKLDRYDPRFVLHRTLAKNQTATRKLDTMTIQAFIIKAWNAFREGRQIQLLSWKAGGATPDKWPEPI